jgi:hypothetical protein
MAAYYKVEVSLNTNAVEVGVPSPQTVNVVVPTIGPQGEKGDQGDVGNTGPANSLAIGTVSTGAAGSNASATITGAAPSQTLDLSIPRGDKGETGDTGASGPANSLAIGTVTTGAEGSSADATISGTAPSQTLSLVIPVGATGAVGATGPQGPAGTATTSASDLTSGTLADARLSGNVALEDVANTFTQNQTPNGTNNVAPNQTAASGSSIMTRALADARYAEVVSSNVNANQTAADLSNFFGTSNAPATLLINYIPSKAIVYAVIRFTATPVAATTTNFDARVSIRDVTNANLNTNNTQRWILPCVSVIKISGLENYLLQFESTSPPAGWTTHYNTNGGWLPVTFGGEIINKTGGSLTTDSTSGGWSAAHFYR